MSGGGTVGSGNGQHNIISTASASHQHNVCQHEAQAVHPLVLQQAVGGSKGDDQP